MPNTLIKWLWSSETKTANPFRVSAAIAAAVLAATVVVLAVATRPAEAAFPGANGAIAYTSGPFSNLDIYRIDPDGSAPTNLTSSMTTTSENLPAWSSEGHSSPSRRITTARAQRAPTGRSGG